MKQDFEKIRRVCERNSQISEMVLEDALIPYAASRKKVEPLMEKRFRKYRSTFREMPSDHEYMFRMQYLTHLIFRENGIAARYNLNSILRDFNADQQQFVKDQLNTPWRFTFCRLIDNPATNFYWMKDEFRGVDFLLYSPGVSTIREDKSVILWNTLIGYNGACWQAFGPVVGYTGFDEDDIFFYATESTTGEMQSDEDFINHVENNPVPYMALAAYSNRPIIMAGDDEIRYCTTEGEVDQLPIEQMENDFYIRENKGVYKLELDRVAGDYPHNARVFHDTNLAKIMLISFTRFGYKALIEVLASYGYKFAEELDMYVHPSMHYAVEEVYKRDVELFPYDHLFEEEKEEYSPEQQAMTDKLNAFIDDVMDDINEEREPETAKMAERHGLDMDNAQSMVEQLQSQREALKRKYPRN